MWNNCSSKIKYELDSGAVVCMHKRGYHTVYYKVDSLKDLCLNHYIKRYMLVDKTELTNIPNWKLICGSGKRADELDFVMLLCKENVGS